jgi:hypothetical protein
MLHPAVSKSPTSGNKQMAEERAISRCIVVPRFEGNLAKESRPHEKEWDNTE